MTRTIPVNPPRAIRPRANARAIRYWIGVHERGESEVYTIRRTHPDSAAHEAWGGREQGWRAVSEQWAGKVYARYGDAYKTLRAQQARDREACTAEGKRRHLASMAPRMLALLEELVEAEARAFAPDDTPIVDGDWLNRARATIRVAKRGY